MSRFHSLTWCTLLVAVVAIVSAQPQCPRPTITTITPKVHHLKASVDTVKWGYYWNQNNPKLYVNSGDTVTVEMVTHMAGDYYDGMVKGDPALEGIYHWTDKQAISVRGATGAGDGVHILTGPIYMCGAEEGDILQVDILDLQPRVNPGNGKTYGVNGAARWGYQFRAGFLNNITREISTIYEIITDAQGTPLYAVPDFQFNVGNGPNTSCVPLNGTYPDAMENLTWSNPNALYRKVPQPCVDGRQHWTGYTYPGVITQHPTGNEDYSIRGMYKVPLNYHIGNIGVAPKYPVPVSSVPPGSHGGNMDNRRIGKGATLYLRVQNKGALLSMGDCHAAQGDSEFDGMGIETSINGKFRLTLIKNATAPPMLKNLNFPLIENKENYIVQGYAYNHFLTDPTLQPNPQVQVLTPGSNLDLAFTGAYDNARQWLMDFKNMTEDQVNTFITVMCDYGTTQVVDGNFGVHLVVPKYAFSDTKKSYEPKVVCGTSTKLPKTCYNN
ncbi:hypothetical protein CEUSTIGMA_g8220.t1 [Chlamydomonas eustigma]|uniref:Acetamidase n=1 Tax=Chlamydomonas eustigma TaxID=1157962 RepID=A0A250XCI9_9CHLO|nr:hypothetical protein CEUSTIGMA_g8220.t1 [Chlamydomonas eustigma]|eukprot:GAX80784.1 hypothetical protein CEUSTIGMA_g8220.t1 [Chlamydomonas eustigma]